MYTVVDNTESRYMYNYQEQLVCVRIYAFLAIVYFKTALKVKVLFISVKCIYNVTTSIQVSIKKNMHCLGRIFLLLWSSQ